MTNHLRADGRAKGVLAATVGPMRPALTDIPGACAYLGNVGRSKFYSDILPQLDIAGTEEVDPVCQSPVGRSQNVFF